MRSFWTILFIMLILSAALSAAPCCLNKNINMIFPDSDVQLIVKNIVIQSNKKTADNIIRREMLIKKGGIIDKKKLCLSAEKIYDLDLFKSVSVEVVPNQNNKTADIVIRVQELPLYYLYFGSFAGFLPDSGSTSIFGRVVKKNVLNKGYQTAESFYYSENKKEMSAVFENPYFFNQPIAGTFSFNYDFNKNQTNFGAGAVDIDSLESWSVKFKIYKRFKTFFFLGGVYALQYYKNSVFLSEVSSKQAGGFLRNSAEVSFKYDSRNFILIPAKGLYLLQCLDMSFGNNQDDVFNEYETDLRLYVPTFWKFILSFYGYMDIVSTSFFRSDDSVSSDKLTARGRNINEFFLGSPRFPGRGNAKIYFTVKYRFPVLGNYLWFGPFFNTGRLWKNSSDLSFNILDYEYRAGAELSLMILGYKFYFAYEFPFYYDKGWRSYGQFGLLGGIESKF